VGVGKGEADGERIGVSCRARLWLGGWLTG
jgi:hypothetical protein